MAGNLAAKCDGATTPLRLHNRTHGTAVTLAAEVAHAVACERLDDAVGGADIVWSCLVDEAAVVAVYEEMLRRDVVAGRLFVECSTISPQGADALAARVTEAGGTYVAMPGTCAFTTLYFAWRRAASGAGRREGARADERTKCLVNRAWRRRAISLLHPRGQPLRSNASNPIYRECELHAAAYVMLQYAPRRLPVF